MLKKYGGYALVAALVLAVLAGLFPSLEKDWVRVLLYQIQSLGKQTHWHVSRLALPNMV